MIDREKVVVVLKRRFPGSAMEQVAAAANAIMGLEEEWVEASEHVRDWETHCRDGCYLRRVSRGDAIRVFRRTND